ncbi:MAG TPA: lipocalin family protein [Pontiella sp.]
MRLLYLLFIPFLLSGCASTSDLSAVSDFDLERYLGTWYEAVRYDHGFERGMSAVSATYSMNKDGTIKVVNRGYKIDNNTWNEATGVAKPKHELSQGWLMVSFFKPFYGAYKIIYLDPEYTEAIITSSTRRYLWILTRRPVLTEAELEQLIVRAEGFGFDRNKMILVDQALNSR